MPGETQKVWPFLLNACDESLLKAAVFLCYWGAGPGCVNGEGVFGKLFEAFYVLSVASRACIYFCAAQGQHCLCVQMEAPSQKAQPMHWLSAA